MISNKEDAYSLVNKELEYLLHVAKDIRDSRKGHIITYSKKVFIPLTFLCRDTCSYCTYKKEPNESYVMLNEEQVLNIVKLGKYFGCTEALIVTGERPEQRYPEVREWLSKQGFTSTIDYISYIGDKILKHGLLPHTNAGILNYKEMSILRETHPSLGLMLENVSVRLMGPGMPHEKAPSKHPKLRIKMIEDAGRLKIPFTTGLLIGIGESIYEVIDSLMIIKEINDKYHHIQEVIIQNFTPKSDTPMRHMNKPPLDYILRIIAIARILMPDMNVQAPPNLMPDMYAKYIDAGINDWGGISPITIDYVNPEYPWPEISKLKEVTETKGYHLKGRLPVYPEFINKEMLSERVFYISKSIVDEKGYVR